MEKRNIRKKDIFDRIMDLPILNVIQTFYIKYKEALLYLFFGGISVFLNLGIFAALTEGCGVNALTANAIAWIICVVFQFFTNKIWVFGKAELEKNIFFKQFLSFVSGRMLTLLGEELILLVFITLLRFPPMPVKLAAQIGVIVSNYFISKLYVFRS